MVKFKHDSAMKRHEIKVPYSLAGVKSMVAVGHIDEEADSNITLYRELSITLLRQILMHWDEYKHQVEMRDRREAGEFDKYFDEEDDKPTFH